MSFSSSFITQKKKSKKSIGVRQGYESVFQQQVGE
jgi:hypothetical protein